MVEVDERFLVAHGSPREPVWEYLLSRPQAEDNFALFEHQVCLVGHSHVPLIIRKQPDGRVEDPALADADLLLELQPGFRYFLNPGSVGQPRNQDPRAAYAWLDSASAAVELRRVEYDIARTQDRMRARGLPDMLAERLAYGM